MKISPAVIVAVASAQQGEKKVPPRHPLQRLNRLVEFTEEIMNDWFGFLPSQDKWIAKFANNADRMKRNFERGNQRCGFYDEDQLPHGGPSDDRKRREADVDRYDREDPAVGIKQLTTGFSKWAQRYLSQCSGQRNYNFQVNRMNKWNDKLQEHLTNQAATSTTIANSGPTIHETFHCSWPTWMHSGSFIWDLDRCIEWCKGTGYAFRR